MLGRQAGRGGAEVGAWIQPVPGDLGCCGLQAGQPKCQPGSHSTYVVRTAHCQNFAQCRARLMRTSRALGRREGGAARRHLSSTMINLICCWLIRSAYQWNIARQIGPFNGGKSIVVIPRFDPHGGRVDGTEDY